MSDTSHAWPKWLEASFTVRSVLGALITIAGLAWVSVLAWERYGVPGGICAYIAIVGLIDFGRWLRK